EGLSPAISIEQKAGSRNPRSTVGTTTEIYDYLRLLFARVGQLFCPNCHIPITSQSMDSIIEQIMESAGGGEVTVYAPLIRGQKGTFEKLVEDQGRAGFTRVRIDGTSVIIDKFDPNQLDKQKKHDVDLFIDRMKATKGERDRLAEAVQSAALRADGLIKAEVGRSSTVFSQKNACAQCGFSFGEIQPRLFSFNSPFGACAECHGLGVKLEIDPELVIPDKSKSLLDGAIVPWNNRFQTWRMQTLAAVGRQYDFDMSTPLSKMGKKKLDVILYGSDEKIDFKYESKSGESVWTNSGKYEGVIPSLERTYRETESESRRDDIARYMRELPCPSCEGKRLKPEALAVKIKDQSIIDLTRLPVSEAYGFFADLKLKNSDAYIARPVLKEVKNRLDFLLNVGLGYLTLDRVSGTLSGGEGQRIRLATQIGANLTGVLYVLDEPSIGLHQRDNAKLLSTLKALRDLGNTLIVVEHDEDTMRASDFLVDIGPGAGVHGGEIVAAGDLSDIMGSKKSITGAYLRKELTIATPPARRKARGWLTLRGCTHNN
ncbi:MAG: excinuclease ABC subunit UvrA, partial [Candidatus Micrarchaeota archaeon]|nr:excinuclease ABC subunit UvrA [Candidatus Micrarchaeota archaeon]